MNLKRGAIGFGIIKIYQLSVLILIAVAVLSIGSVLYRHEINLKDIESKLILRGISECLVKKGIFDLSGAKKHKEDLFEYCGYKSLKNDAYLEINVTSKYTGDSLFFLGVGNEDVKFKESFFKKTKGTKREVGPGFYERSFSVLIKDGAEEDGIFSATLYLEYDSK